MSKKILNQLSELKGVNSAPALWRSQNRADLLRAISVEPTKSYSWVENLNIWQLNFRHTLAPIRLAPMLASILIVVFGAVPFAQAMNASLPGQTLYPIKRLAERAELSWYANTQNQGVFYLELASRRLKEIKKVDPQIVPTQAWLLREYNIALAYAEASLQSTNESAALVAKFDSASLQLTRELRGLATQTNNKEAYQVALAMTEKLSSNSLAALINSSNTNPEANMPVTERLEDQIAQAEEKLNTVDGKLVKLPVNKPLPRVVVESKQAVMLVKEASKQAKESLAEAKQLIAKKNFTLALQKVQEVQDITKKSEDAINKVEAGDSTKPEGAKPAEGKVEGTQDTKVDNTVDAKPAAVEVKPEVKPETPIQQ